MAKTYNKMQIDMNGDILSSVTAVAKDTLSRYLDCYLYNNGVPIDLTGHMAQIYVTKPDKTLVVTNGEITDATAGRVQFELTNQTLAVTGVLELQVVLTSGAGEVLSSDTFNLHVLPSLRNDEAIESTNEFGALVVLFQEIQNSLDLMKAIVDGFGQPGEVAEEFGVTTFWGILEASLKNVDFHSAIKAYINNTIDGDYTMPINKMISSLSGTAQFVPLDLLIRALFGSTETFTTDGTFTVPEGVTKIKVTAAGGGGGGAARTNGNSPGGGGASCVIAVFDVVSGTEIAITIGKGGEGGSKDKEVSTQLEKISGTNGGATIVGTLLTVPGGYGGTNSEGGAAGGPGGGRGAEYVDSGLEAKGEDGAFGRGGTSVDFCGGGGGSYGDGGTAIDSSNPGDGIYGGGGSGGGYYGVGGGKGGDGIVIIEWGADIA